MKRGVGEILAAPEKFPRVHLMGIGGIGMAGLARLLVARGFRVTGCDIRETGLTRRLAGEGIEVAVGHAAGHVVGGVDWVVFSSAVGEGNEERRCAEEGVPCFRRGEVLGAFGAGRETLAVGGTHGKTTTASMLLHIMRRRGVGAGWCIGGEVWPDGWPGGEVGEDFGGGGGRLVMEADESDGTLACYRVATAVVSAVERDHMEHFKSYDELLDCFRAFLKKAGRRIVCADSRDAAMLGAECGAVCYGLRGVGCRFSATGLGYGPGGIDYTLMFAGGAEGRHHLPVPGGHNLLNALGAMAAAETVGIGPGEAAEALEDFHLPGRRMEEVAVGGGIRVLADYAHHPSEIRALLLAVRQLGPKRVLVVFQPHRYTRTREMGEAFPGAFGGADWVLLLPVYAASEAPLAGGRSTDLAKVWRRQAARGAGVPVVEEAGDFGEAAERLGELWREGDMVVLVGAGDIIDLAPMLAERLAGRG